MGVAAVGKVEVGGKAGKGEAERRDQRLTLYSAARAEIPLGQSSPPFLAWHNWEMGMIYSCG